MNIDLDDRATVVRLDPEGMLGRIESLPEQCAEAWERARALDLPQTHRDARDVVLLGMGGSGIAGDILRTLTLLSSAMPVQVARGYDVPASVGEGTLAVACSHSGNTEETLSAFRQAVDAGAKTFVITKGGELKKRADEAGAPTFLYEYEGEPRSALGHQLMALLAVGEQAGLLGPQKAAVTETIDLMKEQRSTIGFDVPAAANPCKQLALRLQGKLTAIVGAGVLDVAAYRWKTQINENADSWAIHESLPELDHNSIVGFGLPDASSLRVVFLRSERLDPHLLARYGPTADALADAGVAQETVAVAGTGPLARVLAAIHYGDYVSYYLGLLNGVNPSAVGPIETLKEKLAGG